MSFPFFLRLLVVELSAILDNHTTIALRDALSLQVVSRQALVEHRVLGYLNITDARNRTIIRNQLEGIEVH